MEVACVLLFPIIQAVRLTAGSAGSRSEQLGPLLLMLGLSVPLIAYFVYFLFYQVYVCASSPLPLRRAWSSCLQRLFEWGLSPRQS